MQDPLCMNLMIGGEGGWNNLRISVRDNNGNKFRIDNNDPRFLSGELKSIQCDKLLVKDKLGKCYNVNRDDPRYLSGEFILFWLGRKKSEASIEKNRKHKHSIEAKNKIGEKNSINQIGKNNSHFGNCWIHHLDLKQSKSIKKEQIDQYLTEGWIKGRKIKF